MSFVSQSALFLTTMHLCVVWVVLTTMHLWVVLTTMHLCELWFFLTTMHLCVLWVIPHHYAPLCISSPLCTFVFFPHHYAPLCFFVTFSVLFVTYVCCVCVCVCLVKLLSFNISHVDLSNTPELVFNSSNSSHCGPPPPHPQLSAQPINSCLTRQTPLTVVPHPPTICPTPQLVFDSSNSSHCGPPPPNYLPNPSTRV